jgi:predicted nucleic acid-binding protein
VTPDSSVVIAAFASWNEHHDAAVRALADARDLVAQVALESYSVLTRLPEPFRAAPGLVAEYLREDYPGRRMVLPERQQRDLLGRLADLSIAGGAVYDASVASTAAHHGHPLLSCDRRARPTYEKLGIEVRYL